MMEFVDHVDSHSGHNFMCKEAVCTGDDGAGMVYACIDYYCY